MPDQTASRQQDAAQPNVQFVPLRAAWLQQLRERLPVLNALNDAAMDRVLDKSSDLDKMRGQIVEELGGLKLAESLGPGHEYIRGDRINIGGRQATDGMIVRQAEDEPGVYEILAIAEAKAGRASSRGIESSSKTFPGLKGQELENLEREAIEEIRKNLGLTTPGAKLPAWATSDRLRQTHADQIAAAMRQLHGPDMGQLQRDLERLMPGIEESAVKISIDEEPRQVRASRNQTEFLVITPSDVATERMLDRLEEKGIHARPVAIELTSRELASVALQLQQFHEKYQLEKPEEQVMPKMNVGQQAAATQGATSDQSALQTAAADNKKAAQENADNRPQSSLTKVLDFLVNGVLFDNAAEKQKDQQSTDDTARLQDDAQKNLTATDKEQNPQQTRDRDTDQDQEQKKAAEKAARADDNRTNQTTERVDADRAATQPDDERLMQERGKVARDGQDLDKARVEQQTQAQTREQQDSAQRRQALQDEQDSK